MTIESCVILSLEELETLNQAMSIFEDYCSKSILVNDSQFELREKARRACSAIDDFICEHADRYEK